MNFSTLKPFNNLKTPENGFFQLIAFGLNYSIKKIRRKTRKVRFFLHYHKALTLDLNPYPIIMKVFKRRISFYGNKEIINSILNYVCSLKRPQMYTGKALRPRYSRYRVKLMPRDMKDKRK